MSRVVVMCKSISSLLLLSSSPSLISTRRRLRIAASRMASTESSLSSPSSAIDFLSLCHRLKTTKRAGWLRKEVQEPESIADHMYRMGLMALIAPDVPGVNREKCIKMAIVHDIAEAIVGDITPSDGVPKEEKSRREQEALKNMCELLGAGPQAKEISDLWMEYEENSSLEAKVVKDFDKVEMILQALEYETEQGKDLEEFFTSTAVSYVEGGMLETKHQHIEIVGGNLKQAEKGKFHTEVGKAWASEIASRRRKQP